jgi:anti-anti-sigma regulatory factor
MSSKLVKNVYFQICEETDLYAHLILSNIFSETKNTEEVYENTTKLILAMNKNIVIDLRENVYAGKSMLAFLVNLDCHLRKSGFSIVLMSLKNRVLALLEWLELDKTIKHVRSSEQLSLAFDKK